MKLTLSCLTAAVLMALSPADAAPQKMNATDSSTNGLELATFGGGCFWCIEAVFERLDGVKSVTSGYTGGSVANPTYEQVCSGKSGHAEVAQIAYDPKKISFEKLLETFWEAHDPTTLNRQGADVGTQYRSAIFYHSDAQKAAAEAAVKKYASDFRDPIVTQIVPATDFFVAEDYHHNYYDLNRYQPY